MKTSPDSKLREFFRREFDTFYAAPSPDIDDLRCFCSCAAGEAKVELVALQSILQKHAERYAEAAMVLANRLDEIGEG